MDFKSIMNPQRWLIGGGVVQLLFSTWLIMAPGDFAESAWSDLTARELEIATAYEMFWGWFGVPWGLWALMVGFMTSGQTQARITALTGAMLLVHSVGFFMMAESQGYGTALCEPCTMATTATASCGSSQRKTTGVIMVARPKPAGTVNAAAKNVASRLNTIRPPSMAFALQTTT